jgi:nucleotide-binding universal stress UspA family protein
VPGADAVGRGRADPWSVSRAKSILVAFDESEAGIRALDAAAQLMGYGSTLTVVGAAEPARAEASRLLRGRQLYARYIDGNGHPSATILAAAAEVEADVIVVAALNDSLDHVVRRAPCDVLVVR